MTNSNEKGERNWFFVIAVVLLLAFLVIAFLCALGLHFYEKTWYIPAVITWASAFVTTYYWIQALFNFVEYVRKNGSGDE